MLGADCPITMCGLDVTEATVMSSAQIATISEMGNPQARLAAQILPFYRDFHVAHGGPDGIHVHDSTCISYLLAPQHYGVRHHPVRVDTGWSVGRGKTWPTTRRAQRRPVGRPPRRHHPHRSRRPRRRGPRAHPPLPPLKPPKPPNSPK